MCVKRVAGCVPLPKFQKGESAMPTDQEVPLFDIRQHMSADQWSHDYLSPASNGKKDQMFGCSVGRRIYQAKMHGIKTLSGNYGGNPLIGKMISLPVSFLTNYGVEHLRHPEENEWQHLGRAGVRVGFEQILGSFIPAYKTVSTIAEVANYLVDHEKRKKPNKTHIKRVKMVSFAL